MGHTSSNESKGAFTQNKSSKTIHEGPLFAWTEKNDIFAQKWLLRFGFRAFIFGLFCLRERGLRLKSNPNWLFYYQIICYHRNHGSSRERPRLSHNTKRRSSGLINVIRWKGHVVATSIIQQEEVFQAISTAVSYLRIDYCGSDGVYGYSCGYGAL